MALVITLTNRELARIMFDNTALDFVVHETTRNAALVSVADVLTEEIQGYELSKGIYVPIAFAKESEPLKASFLSKSKDSFGFEGDKHVYRIFRPEASYYKRIIGDA